ncbi:hypothetical protein Tco_1461463 [Tanacetum coccineum]
MGDENPSHTLGDYSRPSHEGYQNTIELLDRNNVVPLLSDTIRLVQNGCSFHGLQSEDPNQHLKDFLKLVDSLDLDVQFFYDHVNPATRQTIDQATSGKLRDKNTKESYALLEDLALYDNGSWNDSRDFVKPVKEISLPQDVSSTSDRRLIELENQVQCFMEAHYAPKPPVQVNKITSSCEICNGPHNTQYCMENPEQAFVLEVLAHTPMYNEILDKYVESLELGKNGSAFIQGKMLEKIKDPELFTLPCSLGNSKPFDTLADIGYCVN